MKKRKRNKQKINLKYIYLIFFTIITLVFISFLKIINIVPNLYFYPLLGVLLLIYIVVFLLIKKKKKLGYIISIIFIIIYSIVIYYLGITLNFFSSFSKIHYNEETFLVLVLEEENYQNIEDLQSKNIGYIPNSLNSIGKALDKLDKKITIDKEEYKEYSHLFKDLDNKVVSSIIINKNYYDIKNEEDTNDNYKILYTITIRSIVKDTNKTVDVTKDTFTIYISGIDVYGDIETASRSDVNILMTVNPKTKQVLLTSIPRDYYVRLHGTTGYKDKLTHAGNYGINMSVNTIEDLLNIDINYYVRVNFTTLEKLIEALGGVDVYSEYSFISYIDNYQFYKGYNHMNGKEALAFSRERKSLPNGDIDRGKNQEAVIEAIIRKVTSKDVIYKYSKILNNLKGTFQTNLTETDITKLIKKELENIGGWNITSTHLDGTAAYDYTYSYSGQKLYVTIPNEESINSAKGLIKQVKDGILLDSTYSDNIQNIKNPNQVTPTSPKEETPPKEEIKEETVPKEEEKTEPDNIITDDKDNKEENNTDNKEITDNEDNKENNKPNENLPKEEADTQ